MELIFWDVRFVSARRKESHQGERVEDGSAAVAVVVAVAVDTTTAKVGIVETAGTVSGTSQ